MPEIQRKPIRLPQPYYLGYRAYFVTICAKDRKRLFAIPGVVESLLVVFREQSERFAFEVHAYCFMPDHCHLVLAGKTAEANLSDMIRGFKGCSAKSLRKFGIFDAWQKGFYEHILRSGKDCTSAMAYIFENPVRAGLAKDIYTWPFSGSFVLEWREFQPPGAKFVPPYKAAERRVGRSGGEEQPR
jgi:putative transposase